MKESFKSFLKNNWITLFMLLAYLIIAFSVSYGSGFVGFQKTIIVLLLVILMEMRLGRLE